MGTYFPFVLACGETDIDDFGPPAGFAQVDGRVFTVDSVSVGEGMSVALTQCDLPVGGLAGRDETDAGGRFSIRGELPPIGAEFPLGVDSMRLGCEVIAGQAFARTGPVDVWFFRPGVEPTALVLELHP